MIVGETVQLSATVLPSNATEKTLSWASSKQSVATVSGSGLVTALAEGSSTITVSVGGKLATCQVTVEKKVISVTSVTLDKTELTLKEGEEANLVATVKPDDATDKTVTWKSSDTSIVSVTNEGKVSAVKEGTATITASSGDKTASCKVTVKPKDKVWVADRTEYVFMDKVVQSGPIAVSGWFWFQEGTKLSFSSDGTLTIVEPNGLLSTMIYSTTDKGYRIGEVEYILSSNGELIVPFEWAGGMEDMSKWRQEDIIPIGNFNGPLIFTNIRCARDLIASGSPQWNFSTYSFYELKKGTRITRIPCNLFGLTCSIERFDGSIAPPYGIWAPASYDYTKKQIYWWDHTWFKVDDNYYTGDDDLWYDERYYYVITLSSFDYAYEYKQAVLKPEK